MQLARVLGAALLLSVLPVAAQPLVRVYKDTFDDHAMGPYAGGGP